MPWNQCPVCAGIAVQFAPEFATKQLLKDWQVNLSYSIQILGREINPAAEPIEIRRLAQRGRCAAGWVLRWSEFHYLYYQRESVPNLHTKSKGCNFRLNIAKWLEMTDPYNGTYSALVSISVPDVDVLRTLIRLSDECKKGEDGQLRIEAKPKVADCACKDDDQQVCDSDDSIGDEAEAEAEAEEEYFEEEISRSPSKPNVTESVDNDVNDEPESIFFDCIDHSLDLPVKVGVILKVAPEHEELLLNVLDYWGVFEILRLPKSLKEISRKMLARRLSEQRGREITPYHFDIEVKAAHESLIARVKKRLSGEGHSEGEE